MVKLLVTENANRHAPGRRFRQYPVELRGLTTSSSG